MKLQGNELQIQGLVACIDRDNIDTDQIIPTEYLKSIKKVGFEDYLFDGWRYLDDGKLGITKEQRQINKDFILNNAPYDEASILLTRDNFGCGSSREHAVTSCPIQSPGRIKIFLVIYIYPRFTFHSALFKFSNYIFIL